MTKRSTPKRSRMSTADLGQSLSAKFRADVAPVDTALPEISRKNN